MYSIRLFRFLRNDEAVPGLPAAMLRLPPLRFHPLFRDYLWGGTRLRQILGRPAQTATVAESWEIVDHRDAQSVVDGGPWDGWTLGNLMAEHGAALVGFPAWQRLMQPGTPPDLRGRFPLLLKFLDAARDLSVQVHPDDALAATLDPPDLGKTEAWYVLAADPGARIYAGLKPDVTREAFESAIRDGRTADCLHSFEPERGDCVFVPAGTVHAIGAGLLILEVQQASDTTWRIHDWNRVDAQGRRRELHIEPALRAADFASGPVSPRAPLATEDSGCEELVACDRFVIRRWRMDEPVRLEDDGRMRILVVTAGQLALSSSQPDETLGLGDVRLIPASCPPVILSGSGNTELIEITIP